MNDAWAMVIPKAGEPEILKRIEIPKEQPKAGEVAIDVKACGVNFADVVMRMGLYMDAPPMPFVPGYEVAGTISAVGEGVDGFKPGDRVVAVTYFGGYASYVCLAARTVRHLPENMSFEEGASVPVVFLTAYIALYDMCRVREGDRVLLHGVGGGVGLAALQLAKNAGCIVYGTAGSQKKLDCALEMGLDHPINYREQDFVAAVTAISGRYSLDAIMEPRGGAYIAEDLKLLRPTGCVVCLGASSMVQGEKRNLLTTMKTFLAMRTIELIPLINHNQGVYGLNVLHMWENDELLMPSMESVMNDFASGKLKTVISDTFPLDKAADAHRCLQERRNVGKVVLTVA